MMKARMAALLLGLMLARTPLEAAQQDASPTPSPSQDAEVLLAQQVAAARYFVRQLCARPGAQPGERRSVYPLCVVSVLQKPFPPEAMRELEAAGAVAEPVEGDFHMVNGISNAFRRRRACIVNVRSVTPRSRETATVTVETYATGLDASGCSGMIRGQVRTWTVDKNSVLCSVS